VTQHQQPAAAVPACRPDLFHNSREGPDTAVAPFSAMCDTHSAYSLSLFSHSQTLENTREADVTMVSAGDEEVALDEADDEFAGT